MHLVYYNTESETAIMLYRAAISATYAKQFLDSYRLAGQCLEVSYLSDCLSSKYSKERRQFMYNQFIPPNRFNPDGPGIPKVPNQISKTLHFTFTNSNQDLLEDSVLMRWISRILVVVRIKRDFIKRQLNLWFVEFQNEQDAVLILMQMHNNKKYGGYLRISFTKDL